MMRVDPAALSVFALIAAVSCVSLARADLIRITARGHVESIEGPLPAPPEVFIGAPYLFTYVFETTTPDAEPDPQVGMYAGAVRSARFDINGYRFDTAAGAVNILNNGFAGDTYQGAAITPLHYAALNLSDFGGGVFSSDALPVTLDLRDFDAASFILDINIGPAYSRSVSSVETLERIVIPCACDWDYSGVLNSQDFFAFLNDFFAQQGDFNRDGATNSADFFDYLNCFFAPCP